MESKVYNQKGKETGSVTAPESIFGVSWNSDLVHQVYTSMLSERRINIAHAKMRGEVRGGGKKPWRQKGTGRARHGSTRSPIWVGGGTTHGPRNDKNYGRKVNKTMKLKALSSVLSRKLRDGEILFVDSLFFKAPKTKEAKDILSTLGTVKGFESLANKPTNAAYIAIPKMENSIKKSFQNIKSIEVAEVRNINVPDVLKYRHIIFINPEESFKLLEARQK